MKLGALFGMLLLSGCATTHVTSLHATHDGMQLTATGLRIRHVGMAAWIEQNLEWNCVRGMDERLQCVVHELQLPRPE